MSVVEIGTTTPLEASLEAVQEVIQRMSEGGDLENCNGVFVVVIDAAHEVQTVFSSNLHASDVIAACTVVTANQTDVLRGLDDE